MLFMFFFLLVALLIFGGIWVLAVEVFLFVCSVLIFFQFIEDDL